MSVIRNISVASVACCLAVVLGMTTVASSSPSLASAARDAGNIPSSVPGSGAMRAGVRALPSRKTAC